MKEYSAEKRRETRMTETNRLDPGKSRPRSGQDDNTDYHCCGWDKGWPSCRLNGDNAEVPFARASKGAAVHLCGP